MAALEGRLITIFGRVPDVTQAKLAAFNTQMTTVFGMSQVGTPDYQPAGDVVAASALYTRALVQAMKRVNNDASVSLYLNILWYGVPDMATFKAMARSIFQFTDETIIENAVTLEI